MLKKSRAYFIKDQRNLFIEEPTYRVYRFELNIYVYILQLFLSFVIALHIIFQHTGTNVWNAFYNQSKYSNEIEYVKNNVRTYCNHATRNDYVKKILLEIDDYRKYKIPRRFFISKLIIKVTSHNFQPTAFQVTSSLFFALFNVSWRVIKSFHLNEKPTDRSQVNTISVRKVHPLSGNYVARLLTFLPLYLPPRPRYTYIRALRGPFGSAWADAYTRACRRDRAIKPMFLPWTGYEALNPFPFRFQ